VSTILSIVFRRSQEHVGRQEIPFIASHVISYSLAFVGCCMAPLSHVLSAPKPHWWLVGASGGILVRLFLYVSGMIQKDEVLKFMFYGVEYCSAGELLARAGGNGDLAITLVVVGSLVLVLQFLTDPIRQRIARTPPVL